jgi:glucose-1-phosphate thymidylyltransferase
MTALILAAGYATRLYPITQNFPKALLPVKDKPVVGYLLDDLFSLKSVSRIYLITNRRYRKILSVWLNSEYPDNKIILGDDGSDQPENRLGAIGDLQYLIQKYRVNDDLMVLASDTYTSLKLGKLTGFFKEKQGVVNAVFDTGQTEVIRNRLGCVILKGQRLISFVEKPSVPASTITSIPYYIFPKEVLPLVQIYIRDGNETDAPGSFISWLLTNATKIEAYGYLLPKGSYYYDVGTIQTYNQIA